MIALASDADIVGIGVAVGIWGTLMLFVGMGVCMHLDRRNRRRR